MTPIHGRYQRSQQNDFEADNGFDIDNDGDQLVPNPLDRGPVIDATVSKNVTALVGTTTYLNCRVKNLGNKTVSEKIRHSLRSKTVNDLISSKSKVTWIRHRDLHLLTVGKATYTSDNRFQSVQNAYADEWSLKVNMKTSAHVQHENQSEAN